MSKHKCPKCGKSKTLSSVNFYRHNKSTNGWSSRCKECLKQDARDATQRIMADPERYQRHKDNLVRRHQERYASDPEYRERRRAQARRANATRSPEQIELAKQRRRAKTLQENYGLTVEIFEEMLQNQGNACAICEIEFDRTPHVDHDHVSGEVRGLLCSLCNRGIGCFKDDPERLRNAAIYLG